MFSIFREIEDSQLLGGHMRPMGMMEDHMNAMMGGALVPHRRTVQNPLDPFNMFQGMGGMMNSMIANMHQQPPSIMQDNPNGQYYSSSSVMSYSNDGSGPPKMFQASSSTRQAGDMKETRKMIRNSSDGLEKMSYGRHIGERGHVQTREHHGNIGDRSENNEYIELEEDEADEFHQEWQQKTSNLQQIGPTKRHGQHRPLAITDARTRYASASPTRSRYHSASTAPHPQHIATMPYLQSPALPTGLIPTGLIPTGLLQTGLIPTPHPGLLSMMPHHIYSPLMAGSNILREPYQSHHQPE